MGGAILVLFIAVILIPPLGCHRLRHHVGGGGGDGVLLLMLFTGVTCDTRIHVEIPELSVKTPNIRQVLSGETGSHFSLV